MGTVRLAALVSVVGLLVAALVVGPAAALPGADSDVDYDGTRNGTQAMAVTLNVTTDVIASNVTVTVLDTEEAVVDHDTLSASAPPGVEVTERPRGYGIDRLEPGETVRITVTAYPRTIGDERVDAARILINSDQNPEANFSTATANVSGDSPWFELQRERQRVDDLQSRVATLEQRRDQFRLLGIGGGVVGVLGIVAAVGVYRWRRGIEDDLRTDVAAELDQFQQDLDESVRDEVSFKRNYPDLRQSLNDDHGIPKPASPTVEPEEDDEGPFGGDDEEGPFGGDDEEETFGDDEEDTFGDDDDDDDIFGGDDDVFDDGDDDVF